MFESFTAGFPVLDFLLKISFFLLSADLLIIHFLDGVFECVDDLLLLGIALILRIEFSDNLAQVLLFLFHVHGVAFEVVVLLLLKLLVELAIEA